MKQKMQFFLQKLVGEKQNHAVIRLTKFVLGAGQNTKFNWQRKDQKSGVVHKNSQVNHALHVYNVLLVDWRR